MQRALERQKSFLLHPAVIRTVSVSLCFNENKTLKEDVNSTDFLAHHKKSPGIITLTKSTLFFTPITSLQPKMVIPLNDIRGVKKTGVMGGLSIRRTATVPSEASSKERAKSVNDLGLTAGSGREEIAEELFRWVGGRDELFGRLIAYGNRKWLTV